MAERNVWGRLRQDQHGQWAAVSQATQVEAKWRAERGHGRARDRSRRIRLRTAVWLVRAGLRVADPVTVKSLPGSG